MLGEKKAIFIILHNYLKQGCSQTGIGLFSQAASNRMRGHDLRLSQRRFRLDINRNFTEKVGKDWNGLLRVMAEPPSLQVFKKLWDVSLSAMVKLKKSKIGFNDLGGLLQLK